MGNRYYTDHAEYLYAHVTATPDTDRRFGTPVYDPDYGKPMGRPDTATTLWAAVTSIAAFIPFLLLL